MGAEDYKPGGAHWAKVEAIMSACSCSRLRAVSSLKSCKNNEIAAIESLKSEANTPALSLRPKVYVRSEGASGEASKAHIVYNAGTMINGPSPVVAPVAADGPKASKVDHDLSGNSEVKSNVGAKLSRPVPQATPLPYTDMTKSVPSGLELKWDLHLPTVELGEDQRPFSSDEGKTGKFSIQRLIWSFQQEIQRGKVLHYLSFFDRSTLMQSINVPVCGYPPIFYAVATNDEAIVRAFVDSGAKVNDIDPIHKIPLLAFAVLMAGLLEVDTTLVTLTLLSLGADAAVIPNVFYSPYLDDPIDKAPFDDRYPEFQSEKKQWCKEWLRNDLATAINLTQRYFIYKKMNEAGSSIRQQQVAELHNATALLGISYFLIGQTEAAKAVTQKLLSHMALPKSKPLVMMFAGPSGHGKTELARRMGELLTLEIECIDCTEMKYETDLFGPKKPYIGHEHGSPLNNFLARLGGRRSIVCLDEFEKTTREVQNALLIPFDEGRYVDRRNRQLVDCSQTIWIIATNAVDHIILDHCELHQAIIIEGEDPIRQKELKDELSSKLQREVKMEFGNPLSGRLSIVVPFLPFSGGEAAVIAHKYILELKRKVIRAVELSGKQLVGRVVLDVRRDGALCRLLGSQGYDPDQGARSLKQTVESRIEDELVHSYLEEEGRIGDSQETLTYKVDLARNGVLSIFKISD